MKKRTYGYILIRSVFLVIFISFSFLYISRQIGNEISRNNQKISNIKAFSAIDNFDFSSKVFWLSDSEYLEVKYFSNFSSMLASGKEINLSFLSSNTGSITLINGGPVYYKVFSGSIVYDSGIILDSKHNIPFHANSNLSIKNLGGLAKFSLDFDSNEGIIYPYNYVFVRKNIGGSSIVKQVFLVDRNFLR